MKSGVIKKIVFWTVLIGAGAALVAFSMKPQPVSVDLHTVARGPLEVTLDHEGKTRVRELYTVSAPLNGRVRRIELEPGDPVRANDTVLATFEPQEPNLLDKRTRAEAEARVRAAEPAIARAEAQRQQARASLDLAEIELDRQRKLTEAGIAPQSQLDTAEADVRTKREMLAAAESAKRAAAYELETARAALVEPSESANDDATSTSRLIRLRSPVSGVVMRRLRESEAVVPQGEPLIEVANAEKLEIVADFLSTDAVQMRPGMPAIIDRWGGDEPLHGSVRRIEPSGFMKISALGVEEQRVNVIVDFDDPSGAWKALGDEYRVEVRVVIWQGDDLLLVPTSSLFRHGDGWAVFVDEAGTAHRRPVEVGHRNGVSAEILSGLQAGERIIVYPSDSVTDGVLLEERTTEES